MTAPVRGTAPPKLLIAQYWAYMRGCPFVMDIGEPSCFACGWYDPGWITYSSKPGPGLSRNLFFIWDGTTGLEKAHLVPHSLGGKAEPANLVLLCHDCHVEAPDFIRPQYMLAWMRSRSSHTQRMMEGVIHNLRTFRMTEIPITNVMAALDDPEFSTFVAQFAGIHGGAKRGDSTATLMACLAEFLKPHRAAEPQWRLD